MKKPLVELTLSHFRVFMREPSIIFWALIFPILITWGLGIAFTKKGDDVHHIAYIENADNSNLLLKTYLADAKVIPPKHDEDLTEYSKSVVIPNLGKSYFNFMKCNAEQADHFLKIGKVSLIITETKEKIDYNFDPANPEGKLIYLLLSSAIDHKEISGSSSEIKPLSEIGKRYIDFFVPGIIAMGIMSSLMWGISYGLD